MIATTVMARPQSLTITLLVHRALVLALAADDLLGHDDGPLAGELDDGEDAVGVAEEQINLLEVAAHGLGEEEIHHDGHGARDGGEDDVVLPLDGVDGHGSDHDDDEIPTRKKKELSAVMCQGRKERRKKKVRVVVAVTYQSQWLAVLRLLIVMRSLKGATSVQ